MLFFVDQLIRDDDSQRSYMSANLSINGFELRRKHCFSWAIPHFFWRPCGIWWVQSAQSLEQQNVIWNSDELHVTSRYDVDPCRPQRFSERNQWMTHGARDPRGWGQISAVRWPQRVGCQDHQESRQLCLVCEYRYLTFRSSKSSLKVCVFWTKSVPYVFHAEYPNTLSDLRLDLEISWDDWNLWSEFFQEETHLARTFFTACNACRAT